MGMVAGPPDVEASSSLRGEPVDTQGDRGGFAPGIRVDKLWKTAPSAASAGRCFDDLDRDLRLDVSVHSDDHFMHAEMPDRLRQLDLVSIDLGL